MSFVSCIPLAGDAIGKGGKVAGTTIDIASDTVKYADDVGDALKYADDISDTAGDLLKHGDDALESVGDLTNSSKAMTWNEFQHANKGKYSQAEMSAAWSEYKAANMPNGGEHYLHRPYIRQSTIDAINENTAKNAQGQIFDSIGNKWVDEGNVELAHMPDNEYWRERNWAESQGMTQAEFNDYMNNPDFYAWQDIHDNRSHKYESKY